MKKIILTTLVVAAAMLQGTNANAAKTKDAPVIVNGSVIDAGGAVIGFATIIANGSGDSTVTGASADENGQYSLEIFPGEYSITASLIGYKDNSVKVTVTSSTTSIPTIILSDDTEMLSAASVQAIIPKTKLTGEGLQTSVRGTVLENAGNAKDVLAKTPGMIQGQNGLEVIGKGAPVYYINGRKVTDATELSRLQSNEIQSIEVINNPGAQYNAQVRAVVRIRTIRKQGEGFGFTLDLSDSQSLRKASGNNPSLNVNGNYRINNVDIFAGVNAFRYTHRQESDITGENLLKPRFNQVADLINDYSQNSGYYSGGLNWQISDNHSIGFKISYGKDYCKEDSQTMNEKVWREGILFDDLSTLGEGRIGDVNPSNTSANIYYNGQAGKLGIDLNLDYFGTKASSVTDTKEKSIIEDRGILSTTGNDSRMYAGKLVLSYPIWQGQLQVGTEDAISSFQEEYAITGAPIPSSKSNVDEKNIAAFANYAFYLPKVGQFSAGVRYEHVDYAYECDRFGTKENLDRKYDNFFPSFSYAGVIGKVQAMLNYSVKTSRPSYYNLSDAIRYNNKYTLQSGNASLQPTYIYDLSATAVWKYFTFMLDYNKVRDNQFTWSERYINPDGSASDGVVYVYPKNIDEPVRFLVAMVNATPTIGIWTLNASAIMQQQWLSIDYTDKIDHSLDRTLSFSDKPLFVLQMFNTFRVKNGWQFEVGAEYHSKGYTANMQLTNNYLNLTAAVQKTLLKDGSLVIRLEGEDLAGLADNNLKADFGAHIMTQTNKLDTQLVKCTLRYNFNTASNKYKGSGAGEDVKNRMKQ